MSFDINIIYLVQIILYILTLIYIAIYVCRKDVKTVFVTIPIKPDDWDKHFPHFLKVCTKNHVKKIVKLSFYHSIKPKAEHPSQAYGFPDYVAAHDGFHEVPLVHKHALCDGDLILHKELNETILFSSHLMSNIFRYGFDRKGLAEHHEFYGASGGKGVNYVSPNDVAEVAVHAILDKTHKRQAYTLTGPTITDEEIAKLLTDKIGTTVKYVEKPLTFFDPDTAMLEKIKASGLEENFPAGDVEKVLGRGPETFADYLLATDRMSPIEQDALAIHTPHHCHPKKEVTTKVVEGYEYLLGSRNIPADAEPGVEVAQ